MFGFFEIKENEKGATMIEFALAGALLLAFSIISIDFTRMTYTTLTLQHTATEVLREMITGPPASGEENICRQDCREFCEEFRSMRTNQCRAMCPKKCSFDDPKRIDYTVFSAIERARHFGLSLRDEDVIMCPISHADCTYTERTAGESLQMMVVKLRKPTKTFIFGEYNVEGKAIGKNEPF